MKNRKINKIAIIGSGIMGSGIACHFANIGVEVILLDIIPNSLNDKEKNNRLTLEDKSVRNRLVNDALNTCLKSKPSPIYNKKFKNRISTGNIEDDLHKIKDADWIMEVVVEKLDIKKKVFDKILSMLQISPNIYSINQENKFIIEMNENDTSVRRNAIMNLINEIT